MQYRSIKPTSAPQFGQCSSNYPSYLPCYFTRTNRCASRLRPQVS
uniref:Uncharacterized protein n=1 Tax=Anguilla anguilla TaxID=7936 RepID=A0A0E9SWI4_ANGAN